MVGFNNKIDQTFCLFYALNEPVATNTTSKNKNDENTNRYSHLIPQEGMFKYGGI